MSDSKHIVCPHCDAVNRVPSDKLAEQPTCGKCKKPLFTAHPVELTEQNFMLHVTRNDIPVLVDFWAPWCPPCRVIAPILNELAAEYAGRLTIAKLNTEEAQQISMQYNIQSIPTLALFRDGKEVARKLGAMDAALIQAWIRANS